MPAASEQLMSKSIFTITERFDERHNNEHKRNANEPSLSEARSLHPFKSFPLILRNLILTIYFQTLLAHLCVAVSYCIRCQKKEEKLNFTMMHLF